MVELRGGINTLSRVLAQQVSRLVLGFAFDLFLVECFYSQKDVRIDSYGSWTSTSKPRLPMYKSRFRDSRTLGSVVFPDQLGSPFDNDRFERFLWKTLFSTACDLQFLTHLLELHKREPSKIGAVEREYFEDTYAATQHLLVSLPHPVDVTSRSITYYRQNCWRMGALLYFNIAVRRCPSPNLLKSMTSRLIESFQESDLTSAWAPFSDVLLWILFMGSCGSWDKTEKGWFVLELRRVVRNLHLHSAEEMEDLLRTFLYRSSVFHEPLRELWEEHMQ
jgi:hypothetical protein